MFKLIFDRLLILETPLLLKWGIFYITLFCLLLLWLCNYKAIEQFIFLKTPTSTALGDVTSKTASYALDDSAVPLSLDFFKEAFKPCTEPLSIFTQDARLAPTSNPLYLLRAQRLSQEEPEEKLQTQTFWQIDLQGDYAALVRVFFDFSARCPFANPEALVIEAVSDENEAEPHASVVMHLKIAIPSAQAFLQKPQNSLTDFSDPWREGLNQEKLNNPFKRSTTRKPPAGIIKNELKTYEFS